ncbi:MAG TPA: hypothetical protein VLA74_09320 [Nitrososphaeraceae archaeon]|nr:hypothetical protein [Nitrososphaeraceae archaeon]
MNLQLNSNIIFLLLIFSVVLLIIGFNPTVIYSTTSNSKYDSNTSHFISPLIDLDVGKISIYTYFEDITSSDNSLKLDISDIKVQIEGTDALPQSYIPDKNLPEIVLLKSGNYTIKAVIKSDRFQDNGESYVDLVELDKNKIKSEKKERDIIKFIGECNSNINTGQEKICILDIVINDEDLEFINKFKEEKAEVPELALVPNEAADTEEQQENTILGIPPSSSGTLPLQSCSNNNDSITLFNSKYNFDAITSIAKIKKIIKPDNKELIFEIGVDGQPLTEGAKLTVANSLYTGQIYSNQRSLDYEPIGFQIKRIHTGCEIIPATINNSTESEIVSHVPATINNSTESEIVSNIIQPLFYNCQSIFNTDNTLSFYKIAGKIKNSEDLDKFEGEEEEVRLQIEKNGKNIVTMKLIIDPNTNDSTAIEFTFDKITTECRSIGFAGFQVQNS